MKPWKGTPQRIRRLLLLATASALFPLAASAGSYPERAITMVVPTSPGGGNDAIARVVAQKMSVLLGQTVVVENRAGANGAIASEYIARAPADGYSILFGYIGTHGMNPALQAVRYDPIGGFTPIGMVCESPTLMVVSPSVTDKTVEALVADTRAHPDRFNYASAGNGTAPHFAAEMFKIATGAQMAHIPYKGSAPAMLGTISGQTQVMFPSLIGAYPHVQSGKLRAVAIAGSHRSPVLPDVPTLEELGVKGVDVTQWYALFAPAQTPRPLIDKLNQTLNAALADPDVVKHIQAEGATVQAGTPAQLDQRVRAELVKWKEVVAKAQLHAE